MLIAAIAGLNARSTMDLDTTLKSTFEKKEQISAVLSSICKVDLNDDVFFEVKSWHSSLKMMFTVDIV